MLLVLLHILYLDVPVVPFNYFHGLYVQLNKCDIFRMIKKGLMIYAALIIYQFMDIRMISILLLMS